VTGETGSRATTGEELTA